MNGAVFGDRLAGFAIGKCLPASRVSTALCWQIRVPRYWLKLRDVKGELIALDELTNLHETPQGYVQMIDGAPWVVIPKTDVIVARGSRITLHG